MYKVTFSKPIKTKKDLCSKVKQAYIDSNIPVPYPAANKQLQQRLTQFVARGLLDEQSISVFDKVNSNRTYTLEKRDHLVRLMMTIKEKDETKKLVVLSSDEEIEVIVSSFIAVFEETGFIESAPKCHKRLHDLYAISNKRIRIVQRTLAKFIAPVVLNDENKDIQNEDLENKVVHNEDDDDEDVENNMNSGTNIDNKHDGKANSINNGKDRQSYVFKTSELCNNSNPPSPPSYTSVITRAQSKLNNQNIMSIKRTTNVGSSQKKKKKSK